MSTKQSPAAAQIRRGEDKRLRRFGYAIILVVFGGLGTWSSIAPIDSAAVAPGVVTVQSYRKTVQHLEGGIVRDLRVQDGQQVEAGDVLLELEGTQFRAELEVLRVQQVVLKAQEARLLAERDKSSVVEYPEIDGFSPTDSLLVEARGGQETLFQARRKAYDGEVSVLSESVTQLRAQIAGLNSVDVSKRELLDSYQSEIADLRKLLADGLVDRQRLRELERNVATLKGDLAELQASAAESRAKISEAELRMLQVEREFQTQVAEELGQVQARLSDVNERLGAANDRVQRTIVRAPVAGRVLGLSVHTIGGVVAPGQELMEIIPDRETLIVEGHVSPNDIDRVYAGLAASIRFSSFKRDLVPYVDGKVIDVSADRLVDEATRQSYFLARVEIDAAGDKLRDVELKPGMPAEVLINTGSRTLLGYLFEPLGDSLGRSFRED